jgi:hypothetical protein
MAAIFDHGAAEIKHFHRIGKGTAASLQSGPHDFAYPAEDPASAAA